jgi:hypothetical protein
MNFPNLLQISFKSSAFCSDIMEDVAKMIYVALTNMANDPSITY